MVLLTNNINCMEKIQETCSASYTFANAQKNLKDLVDEYKIAEGTLHINLQVAIKAIPAPYYTKQNHTTQNSIKANFLVNLYFSNVLYTLNAARQLSYDVPNEITTLVNEILETTTKFSKSTFCNIIPTNNSAVQIASLKTLVSSIRESYKQLLSYIYCEVGINNMLNLSDIMQNYEVFESKLSHLFLSLKQVIPLAPILAECYCNLHCSSVNLAISNIVIMILQKYKGTALEKMVPNLVNMHQLINELSHNFSTIKT